MLPLPLICLSPIRPCLNWTGSHPTQCEWFFILELENGEEMSFSFDPDFVDSSPNEHAICQAVMEIKKPLMGIVSARLTLNGKPISNICKILLKELKIMNQAPSILVHPFHPVVPRHLFLWPWGHKLFPQ